jgi:hypothetical protein
MLVEPAGVPGSRVVCPGDPGFGHKGINQHGLGEAARECVNMPGQTGLVRTEKGTSNKKQSKVKKNMYCCYCIVKGGVDKSDKVDGSSIAPL